MSISEGLACKVSGFDAGGRSRVRGAEAPSKDDVHAAMVAVLNRFRAKAVGGLRYLGPADDGGVKLAVVIDGHRREVVARRSGGDWTLVLSSSSGVGSAGNTCQPRELCYIRLQGEKGAGWFLGVMEDGGQSVDVALTRDSKSTTGPGRAVRKAHVTSVTTSLPVFVPDGKLAGVGSEKFEGWLAVKAGAGQWPEERDRIEVLDQEEGKWVPAVMLTAEVYGRADGSGQNRLLYKVWRSRGGKASEEEWSAAGRRFAGRLVRGAVATAQRATTTAPSGRGLLSRLFSSSGSGAAARRARVPAAEQREAREEDTSGL